MIPRSEFLSGKFRTGNLPSLHLTSPHLESSPRLVHELRFVNTQTDNADMTDALKLSSSGPKTKICFVTIGATASFSTLIRAVLSPAFFAGLEKYGYTDLLVQYGADGAELYRTELGQTQGKGASRKVIINGFGLDQMGLGRYMRLAKNGVEGKGMEGVVVSHAGTRLPRAYGQGNS